MKLTNEFLVAAPLERTWAALLDVPRVARALPGAVIEPEEHDGAWQGTRKVKLGAVTAEYAGTARLDDVDEDDRVASFHVQARERRGQGTAAATITSRLAGEDGATRVRVETDLQVTGRQAQLGSGLMQDVAANVLDRFAAGLERELAGGGEEAGAAADAGREDVLDVGAAVRGPLLERAGLIAGGAAAVLVAGWLVWGRGR
jgi:carbon monoxide dehydrogenase subunit G